MKHLLCLLALLLVVGSAPSAVAREQQLEIIPLRHRLVRDVLPQLQALLAPEGTLTGNGSQLIVRTTPENLAELKLALSALDTAPIRLRVTVSQSRRDETAASGAGARVTYETTGNAATPGPLALAPEVYSTRTSEGMRLLQTVLTMDGQPALIDIGQTTPQPFVLGYVITPMGPAVNLGMGYQTASSGFYVTPSLRGETVEIALDARLQANRDDAPARLDSHQTRVTVSGRLGEWVAVGGTLRTVAGEDRKTLAQGAASGSSDYQLWVRIERAP